MGLGCSSQRNRGESYEKGNKSQCEQSHHVSSLHYCELGGAHQRYRRSAELYNTACSMRMSLVSSQNETAHMHARRISNCTLVLSLFSIRDGRLLQYLSVFFKGGLHKIPSDLPRKQIPCHFWWESEIFLCIILQIPHLRALLQQSDFLNHMPPVHIGLNSLVRVTWPS